MIPANSNLLWRRLMAGAAAFLLTPVVITLAICRTIFFAVIHLLGVMRQIVLVIHERMIPRRKQARLLPFWVAWALAVMLLAGGFAGITLVIGKTSDWSSWDQWITRGAVIMLALCAFYLAFRLALHGTAALQRALAHNLAMLISFELAELLSEAEQRAQILATKGELPAFRLPYFQDEREDIARLLGQPTEEALRCLLHSLEAFNASALAENHRRASNRLIGQLADIDDQLGRAMSAIDPFCHRLI